MYINWKKGIYGSLMAALIVGSVPTNVMADNVVPEATNYTKVVEKAENAEATVFEEAKISEEQAMEIAKKVVGDVEGYQDPNIHRRTDRYSPYEQRDVWEIFWDKPGPKYSHANISIDANTGAILNFYKSSNEQKKMEFPPKVKYEDAVKIAEKLLKDLYGDKVSKFKHDEREYDDYGKIVRTANDNYNVRFIELINGVPFPRNSASVQIDGNGEITSFNYSSMNNVEFADKNGILSKEEVLKLLNDKFSMRLAYVNSIPTDYRNPGEIKQFLSYQPNYPNYFNLDAKTGEFLDYGGNVLENPVISDQPLSDEVYPRPENKGGTLTKEEAFKRLKEFIDIPEEVTINSSSLDKNPRDGSNPTWRFQFEYRHGNGAMGWTGGVIDAVTGEILQMDKSSYLREKLQESLTKEDLKSLTEQQSYSVSQEAAKEKAIAYLKEHAKSKLYQLYEAPMPTSRIPDPYNPIYNFSFERKVNGIAVTSDRVHIGISAEDGEVVNFYQNWDYNLQLPEVKDVITPEQAKEIYLNTLNLDLEYQVSQDKLGYYYRSDIEWGKGELEPLKANLIYRNNISIREPNYIDAATGKLLSLMSGQEINSDEEASVAEDIAGHWAEKELKYLLEIKAIDEKDGLVNPNEVLNRGEFVDTLRKVFESYPSYYPYQQEGKSTFKDVDSDSKYYIAVEWANQRGLLEEEDNFRPEDPITREEAANILVNALGYGKLADQTALFNLNFKDSKDIDYKGQVAIIDHLDIMNGVNEKFMPDKSLTKAETAVIFYRFLDKRNKYQVTDVPLY